MLVAGRERMERGGALVATVGATSRGSGSGAIRFPRWYRSEVLVRGV